LVQLTLRSERPAQAVIDDLAQLNVADTRVAERGATYLVIAPPDRRHWGPGRAVALAAAICLAVLIGAAASVVVIAFLPLALLPFVPLLVEDLPMVAVGAVVDDDGATRITVHGQAWGALRTALDAYLASLPPARPGVALRGAASTLGSTGATAGAPGDAYSVASGPEPD